MKVRVVLFAKPRELVGQPNIDLALPAGATAADAWSQLSTQYDLGPLPRSFRCAVNSEYAGWDDPLKEGDELAVIPPVSGGAIGERRGVVALREEPLDPMAIAADIRSDADGALVLFVLAPRLAGVAPWLPGALGWGLAGVAGVSLLWWALLATSYLLHSSLLPEQLAERGHDCTRLSRPWVRIRVALMMRSAASCPPIRLLRLARFFLQP